jgi:DNA-binding NtrC family response regulator/serine/threonine protein kinase/tetratricopeptide (TPR) repeat protein
MSKARASFHHPRYRLSGLLGEGGMGRVYLAEDRLDENRQVAVKVYPSRFSDERLRREFVALRELRHPSIARAFHFGFSEEDGAPFFTLEYVKGKSLTEALWGTFGEPVAELATLPPGFLEAALSLFKKTAAALAYLHRRDVLHLDVKPENILLCEPELGPDSRPLLIDFGLVRAYGGAKVPVGHATLPYAAPELLGGKPPTPACDVYSLAATFYHAFAARPPVAGRNVAELERAHRNHRVPPIPALPRDLERILLRALAKAPGRRYKDALEMASALEESSPGRREHPPQVAFHEPDFVGRKDELSAVHAWLKEDRRACPVLSFSGGGGWGKTRLLERIETDLELASKKTLLIRCAPDEGRAMLERSRTGATLLQSTASSERQETHPGHPSPTRKPTERASDPGRQADPAQDDADLDARVTSAAIELLPLLAADTFLIVDDLHHAGEIGEELITRLSRALSEQPTAPGGGILVSERNPTDRAATRKHELGPLERRDALRIDLEGLSGALAQFSSERVRRLKSSLYEAVGGHPLFFVRGLLDLAGETASAEALTPVDRLHRQFKRLDAGDNALVTTLACLDRQVRIEELQRLLGDAPSSLDATLENLRRAGWIVTDRGHVRVIHESVISLVLESLTDAELEAAHRRISNALESECATQPSPGHLLQSAWHAARAGDLEHAGKLCRRWAKRHSPVPEALVSRSTEVLTRCADEAGLDRAGKRQLVECAADLLESAGRYRESCELLNTLVRRAETKEFALRRKVGSLALRAGDIALARRHLSACASPEAEKTAPEESIHAAAELALLHHFSGNTDEALASADRGVALWQRCPPKLRDATGQSAAKLHGILGQVYLRRLNFESAIERLTEGLRLAESSASKPNIALLLNNLALAHHLAGRFAAALTTFERAESLARELGDHAALISITANVVQIHSKRGQFQTAATALEELEHSPAARQSPRLRLGCLYSRGLLLNLHHGHADRVWDDVQSVAEAVGDSFLMNFARLYRAEGALFCGRLLEARTLLAKKPTKKVGTANTRSRPKKATVRRDLDQVHETLRSARSAAVEALLGQEKRSQRLQDTCSRFVSELPTMLGAWTHFYLGMAALETGCFEAADQAFTTASRDFDATDFAAGRLECALARADLYLVWQPSLAKHKRLAQRHLDAARKLQFEPHDGAVVRERGLRTALLEARALCLELARWVDGAPAPGTPDALERNLADLLARVAGDAALSRYPHWQLELEALNVVALRLRGEGEAARNHWAATEKQRAQLASKLPTAERPAYRARDIWRRLGLSTCQPPSSSTPKPSRKGGSLERLIDILEGGTVKDGLRLLCEALDATNVELLALPPLQTQRHRRPDVKNSLGSRSQKKVPNPSTGKARHTPKKNESTIFGFVRRDGRCLALLKATRAEPFGTHEQTVLESAAKILAVVLLPREKPIAGPDVPNRSSPNDRTATLPLTQTLAVRTRSSVTDILREEGVVASGREIRRVIAMVERLANSDISILITGESGTGKDVVARLVHRFSPRSDGPFVSQNASALPEELFEADLFGYEQGAFTGAEQNRTGFLFRATGGTFHLEEIGDLAPIIQQRLLRVLEENVVRPLGATTARSIDARFIASTHRDLEELVRADAFRKDLFFRLCGARIHVPPLRERLDEIPALAEYHWKQLTGSSGRFPTSTRRILQQHDWPGNVRELITVLRRLALDTTGTPSAGNVRNILGENTAKSPFATALFETRTYDDLKRGLDETYLRHLFETHGGNLERIATELRTTTRSVYRKFSRLGLKPKDFTGTRRGG